MISKDGVAEGRLDVFVIGMISNDGDVVLEEDVGLTIVVWYNVDVLVSVSVIVLRPLEVLAVLVCDTDSMIGVGRGLKKADEADVGPIGLGDLDLDVCKVLEVVNVDNGVLDGEKTRVEEVADCVISPTRLDRILSACCNWFCTETRKAATSEGRADMPCSIFATSWATAA